MEDLKNTRANNNKIIFIELLKNVSSFDCSVVQNFELNSFS